MNYKYEILFSLKVWLFSVLVSPMIGLILSILFLGFQEISILANFLLIYWIFGAILSIPSLILFTLGVGYFNRQIGIENPRNSIFILAVIICFLPITLLALLFGQASILLFIPYFLTITYGIMKFKLKPRAVEDVSIIEHLVE